MKTTLFSILASCVFVVSAWSETNAIAWPKKADIPKFSTSMLASNVYEAACRFRNANGTNRYEDAQILDHELAPGISLTEELDPKWLMTEDDVISLLGKPDGRKPAAWLRYNIGSTRGLATALLLVFKNGYLHSIYETRSN